ncbi:MAG: NADP-dependent malic enzyme [Thaumarchaeota archaeon]|nr:NADP-dependent malic enzyme [Nitrososphaerota archaeon]
MPSKEPGDEYSRKAIRYSAFYGGKIGTAPKVPIRSLDDFSIWYTPGVAAVSRAIAKNRELSFEYTNRWNTIGILTDGTRVLGLGNIGPEGSLPVMEGKALIYKYLGGVDAIPIPIRVDGVEQFVATAKSLEPALGGINLEDIASPKCFEILERLRNEMSIPIWHDDQQGTAGVTLAALYNALELTDRDLRTSKMTLFGSGAANIATAKLLIEAGADAGEMILVDSKGVLNSERDDMDQLLLRNRWKYELALKTNEARVKGGLAEALRNADVLIAAATPGPNLIKKQEIARMNKRAVAFLLANPIPEMWPDDAAAAGAEIVATGRSDFPNQVNNSLLFPAAFRGVLDVRAKTITDSMVIAAAQEMAKSAREKGLRKNYIIPDMLDWEVLPRVAAAIGMQAQREGQARKKVSSDVIYKGAKKLIDTSRKISQLLVQRGIIPAPPP